MKTVLRTLMQIDDVIASVHERLVNLTDATQVHGIPSSQFAISRQKNLYTCGSRSTYMILRHLGHAASHQDIRQALGTNARTGTHERAIAALFRCTGYTARIMKKLRWKSLTKVLQQGGLLLASVDGDDHYLVVHGVTSQSVHLADPFDYRPWRRIVSRREFMRRWDRWGVVVFR